MRYSKMTIKKQIKKCLDKLIIFLKNVLLKLSVQYNNIQVENDIVKFCILSILPVLIGILLSIVILIIDLPVPHIFYYSRPEAKHLLESTINNLITIFGVFIAIGAILFSIIQSHKQDEDIISVIIRESFLLPCMSISILSIIFLEIISIISVGNFIPSNYFIRLTIFGAFLLVFNTLMIGYLIIKIYSLLNSDLLFDKYLKRIINYVQDPNSESKSGKISKQILRFEQRFSKSLNDLNIDQADKIFVVYQETYKINPLSQIYQRLWMVLKETHNDLLTSNLFNSLNQLYHYYFETIYLLIKANDLGQLKRYTNLPSIMYYALKSNKGIPQEINYILSEKIQLLIEIKSHNYDNALLPTDDGIKNDVIYELLYSLTLLMRSMIIYQDLDSLIIATNKFRRFTDSSSDDYDVLNIKDRLFYDNLSSEEIDMGQLSLLNKRLFFSNHIFYLSFGLRAWVLRGFFASKYTLEFACESLEIIAPRLDYSAYDLYLMFDCLSNRNQIFRLSEWESETNIWKEGEVFYSEGALDWLIDGIIFEIIRSGLEVHFSNKILWEHTSIIDHGEYIIKRLEFWKFKKELLFKAFRFEEEKLLIKLDEIKITIQRELQKVKNKRIIILSNSEISPSKINTFINDQGAKWKQNNIENIFNYYKNIQQITDISKKLKSIGFRINLLGGKNLFVNGKDFYEFGSLNLVTDIKNKTRTKFFEILKSFYSESENIEYSLLINAIETSLVKISKDNAKVNFAIFCKRNLCNTSESLIKSKFYKKPDGKMNDIYPTLGYYKNIPIFEAFEPFSKSELFICSFPDFILLKERSNEEWYDSKLKIQVSAIDMEKAKEIYDKNPIEYSSIDGISVDEKMAILNITNAVSIFIERTLDFEIINKDKGFICTVNE